MVYLNAIMTTIGYVALIDISDNSAGGMHHRVYQIAHDPITKGMMQVQTITLNQWEKVYID